MQGENHAAWKFLGQQICVAMEVALILVTVVTVSLVEIEQRMCGFMQYIPFELTSLLLRHPDHCHFFVMTCMSSQSNLFMHFMKIERYQDKPFQSFIKTYCHTLASASCYDSPNFINQQTTVLTLKNDINITALTDTRAIAQFHE
jgi:hypothetical protein